MKRCKGVFLQRGMTLKDAQDFLDNHNLARRLIARGEAFGHPQAANMAKLVSSACLYGLNCHVIVI
jgi:hypothetical protein